MAHKHLKNSGIAAIVLGCALGVAQAAGTTSPPIDPSQLRTLLKLKPGEPLPSSGGGRLTPGPAFTAGWHFEDCTQSFLAPTTGGALTVFAINQDGTFFFSDGAFFRTSRQEILLAACQSTAGYFVHVIDPTALTFDEIVILF